VLLTAKVEPHLGAERPTLLTDYPAGLAPQARHQEDAPWLAEQFELWVRGEELGNSYSEVTNAQEQARRFAHGLDRTLMMLLGVDHIAGVRLG
jgi:lysyl-tRNA synthetase class 2